VIASALDVSLEEALDVYAEIILSPEFAAALSAEHAKRRRKVPLRLPEWVYTEDVESPDGYPCCELVAINVEDAINTTAQALRHEISCQWTVNGDDPQNMGREIKRLIAATRDLFRNLKTLPQVGGTTTTGRADFGPVVVNRLVAGTSGKWIKSASIEVWWEAYARGTWQR
jgi:hypothetical protein